MKLTDEMLEEILKEEIQITASIRERALPDIDSMEPHEFSPKFQKKMQKLMRRKKKKSSPPIRILKRVAIAALCIGLSLFGLSMTAEAVRIEFFKVLTKVYPDWTESTYESNEFDTKFIPCELTHIPEGLKEVGRMEDDISVHIQYVSENGDYFYFDQVYLNGTTFGYDSEDAEITTLQINGDNNAKLVVEDGQQMLLWTSWNSQYSIMSNLPKNELIKAAKSVRPINT